MATEKAALPIVLAVSAWLAGCTSAGDDRAETAEAYEGIGPDETITLSGTEPFWSMSIEREALTYTTPENLDGVTTDVTRFAGNNGLGISGDLEGQSLQIAITPGTCSDGMSDRDYPFTATVKLGDATLFGCGYTDSRPYTGEETP